MIIAGTGHRPNKLGGYSDEVFNRLVRLAEQSLKELKPTKVISGMALGWDQALAQAAINLNIPFIAAIPFKYQDKRWLLKSREYYNYLISKAESVVNVSGEDHYEVQYMQKRNEWMVDNCDALLALYNGDKEGGTFNCIEYANSYINDKAKIIVNVWNKWINN